MEKICDNCAQDDGKDVQAEDHDIFDDISDFSQSEDEASLIGSNADEDPLDWEDEVSLSSESHDLPSVVMS
ncbi:hypothetical protein RHSIM_Rhsim08G0134300 [Rhododendron simsii]|uniref:Uncharacterized protein n=1 Tax=Rhododendron simsii TaxID=118357 RepID=A0A834GMX6_RHOSS|nr:hypothetical protein RHSIM_Rhsim08G0134300 [Rhododendron simsii]